MSHSRGRKKYYSTLPVSMTVKALPQGKDGGFNVLVLLLVLRTNEVKHLLHS